MNIGDYVKVVRFTKEVDDDEKEILLGNTFKIVKHLYEDEYLVQTNIGKLCVFENECEILFSESTYLDKIDELETEIQRLQECIADLEEENDQLSQDLMSITGGF